MIPSKGTSAPKVPSLQPKVFRGDNVLPPFSPAVPRGGWSPATAWAAGWAYADAHDLDGVPVRTAARLAFIAIAASTPAPLYKRYLQERLGGLDRGVR